MQLEEPPSGEGGLEAGVTPAKPSRRWREMGLMVPVALQPATPKVCTGLVPVFCVCVCVFFKSRVLFLKIFAKVVQPSPPIRKFASSPKETH